MRKLFFVISLATSLFLLNLTQVSAATKLVKEESVLLPQAETVDGDFFAAGESVTIAGTVNGDVYAAGQSVIIEGQINGDVLAAGGMVTIRGKVAEDVRVAGGNLAISGQIDGNVTTLGGSVSIADSANIKGSLTSASGANSVFGLVERGITAAGGDITIGSSVNSSVNLAVGQVTLTPSAKINGDLTYLSANQAKIQSGAQVSGNTTHNLPPKKEKDRTAFASVSLGFKLISFLAALVAGLLIIKFVPNIAKRISDNLDQSFLKSLGFGTLVIIVFPVLFVVLLVTIIGIPIALILLAGFLISLYFSKIFFAVFFGQKISGWIVRSNKKNLKWGITRTFIIGLLAFYLLSIIPILGWLLSLIAVLSGLGAIIRSKFSFYKDLRAKKLI